MRLILLWSLMLLSMRAFAQNPGRVKGSVADTTENINLKNVSVVVMTAKDSTLYKFGRTDTEGGFAFDNVKQGSYIIMLSYPKYADFVTTFEISAQQPQITFKRIALLSKTRLLNEVVIKGKMAAIKIKGDTTEFNASSYAIQPNDRVEDLLKKLPGITVDKDGKITAQGKTVPKVLVDGEEFFGDDPTLVTKNLRADMVDKVQLYEKSSDQAAFTGVDDGQKTQTINIKLKENAKKGSFGKLEAGYGSKDLYKAQAMYNVFKGKKKFSVYGTSANNGMAGLNWQDSDKYGGGNNMVIDGGSLMIFEDSSEQGFAGQYYGEGLPHSNNGGAHFDNKWNDDKETINLNYKVGSFKLDILKNSLSQNNLPNGVFNNNNNETTSRYQFRQKLDAAYTIKLDSTSNLKINVDGTLRQAENSSNFNADSRRGDLTLLNTSARTTSDDTKAQNFNINVFYNKKFKKVGRNYSVNLKQSVSDREGDGFLNSKNEFFDENGVFLSSALVDQYKVNDNKALVTNISGTYNEPLSKDLTLVASYGLTLASSTSKQLSYNAITPGNYTELDPDFSNDFRSNQYTNQAGVIFNYKKSKTTLNFGTRVNLITLDQRNLISDMAFNRDFVNWLPTAMFQYRFSQYQSLRISYDGSTTQPSINQLQPLRVNTDPLNINTGNPDLRPSFNNRFSANYNSYKVLTDQSIYLGGSYNFTNNPIVYNAQTDNQGKSIYQSVNLTGQTPSNFSGWGGFSQKIKALWAISVGPVVDFNGSKSFNYVNSQLNTTNSFTISPVFEIKKYTDNFGFSVSFGPSYMRQVSSLQPELGNKGWGKNGRYYFSYKLPLKISIATDGEYTYQPKSATFSNSFEQTIINASVSKAFLKSEVLKFTLSGNDLLNQNRGFRRFANVNSITQTTYNNISRYFMFSLSWDFSKMGPQTKK